MLSAAGPLLFYLFIEGPLLCIAPKYSPAPASSLLLLQLSERAEASVAHLKAILCFCILRCHRDAVLRLCLAPLSDQKVFRDHIQPFPCLSKLGNRVDLEPEQISGKIRAPVPSCLNIHVVLHRLMQVHVISVSRCLDRIVRWSWGRAYTIFPESCQKSLSRHDSRCQRANRAAFSLVRA